MNITEIRAKLAELPPELDTGIDFVTLEATGADELAACKAYREGRFAVEKAYFAWAKEKGADTLLIPGHDNGGESRPAIFCFKEPPGPAWAISKARGAPRGTQPYHTSKKPEGKALQAEIDAMPPLPSRYTVIDRVKAVQNISWKAEGSSGSQGITSIRGRFMLPQTGWAGERYFVVFINPFAALANFLDSVDAYPDSYKELRLDDESMLDWRPPTGWTAITQAKMELAFAMHKVAAEDQASSDAK